MKKNYTNKKISDKNKAAGFDLNLKLSKSENLPRFSIQSFSNFFSDQSCSKMVSESISGEIDTTIDTEYAEDIELYASLLEENELEDPGFSNAQCFPLQHLNLFLPFFIEDLRVKDVVFFRSVLGKLILYMKIKWN